MKNRLTREDAMRDETKVPLDQSSVDHSFYKIWFGLGLSTLALALYAAKAGSVLEFPAFGLIGAYLLTLMPFTARDDTIRAMHGTATNAVVVLLALYLVVTGLLPVIDPIYEVTFEHGVKRPDRIFSGWAAYWLDGLLIGNVAAVAYFATFLFQHYRQRP